MKRPVSPRLDDRSFGQLRADALDRIRAVCPEWTDFSPSDPGIALVEVFAYLTQTLLYRVNRVPDKQYRAFLSLLGVRELPPSAATTTLRFRRSQPGGPIDIPRGTRVAAGSVIFSTTRPDRIGADADAVDVEAFHGELIEGEEVGLATGMPGLEVTVQRPPIIAPMDDHLDLVVAVEELDPIPPEARAIRFGDKTFRVWPEVATFAELKSGERAYVVDRRTGVIQFPPALDLRDEGGRIVAGAGALGAVPGKGRAIRISYRTGGGSLGNLRPETLTALKDRIAGVTVTNPGPAAGGRDAESLDNLAVRGPTDFHRLERVVTARDYETLARRIGGVARAKAFTQSEIWRHAPQGVVEVRVVPTMADGGRHGLADLRRQESADELAKVQRALDDARPVASSCDVLWNEYKPVSITLRAVAAREEDRVGARARILERLERLISPWPRSAWDDGWAHGRALRRYDVEGAVRAEPGILYVTDVALQADRMPTDGIGSLAMDHHQPRTCFAASGGTVFRTMDGGDGWELVLELPASPEAETALVVRASPFHPGHVAVVAQVGDGEARRTYLSRDCGQRWQVVGHADWAARDLAWSERNGDPLLLVATDKGLQEVPIDDQSSPVPLEIDGKWDRGLTSVAVHTDPRGIHFVAVATDDKTGVYLSRANAAPGSFVALGLTQSVIELAIQSDGIRSYLWAGFASPDEGAARYELSLEAAKEGWIEFRNGWGDAGSCLAFGFLRDGRVVAGSHSRGVLWLDPQVGASWERPSTGSGLPIRDETVLGEARVLQPVPTIAIDRSTRDPGRDRILVGTRDGVFRGGDPKGSYDAVTNRARFSTGFGEVVTLPPTWLFCSGTHQVEVVAEDEPEEAR